MREVKLNGSLPAWYKMKRRPKHLPLHKLAELDKVVSEIRARHDVEMVILFGSHARGDWVEDEYEEDNINYEYRSDYDILVVTGSKDMERDVAYDGELKDALEPSGRGTRVNYIVHTIQHVNQMLAERRFFFLDILKEGFLLYDSGRYKLARPPKELPPEVMLRHAEEYFADWMHSAGEFEIDFRNALERGSFKNAAFYIHQATEHYITCLLLVHTGYRPKEHDMEKLLRQAAGFDPRFASVFPNRTNEEKYLFDLLRRAYVDARYNKRYAVTDAELKAIAERVTALKALTAEVCTARIEALRDKAAAGKQVK